MVVTKEFADRITPNVVDERAVCRTRIGVALACLLGNAISRTPIVNSPFGQFLIPIAHEFGWPRERVSGVLGLLAVFSALAYPIIGRWADQYGPRRLILFGNLAFGACVIALGFSTPNIILFYGLFALIGVVGSLPSTMMFNRVISGWFEKNRGTMFGLTAGLGNGIGATIMPIVALILMSAFGWRGAFVGLGGIVIVAGCPVYLFLLKEPPLASRDQAAISEDIPGLSLAQAARTRSFWQTLIAMGLGAGCLVAAMAHIVPILTDRHFSVHQAVLVVSVFALVGAGGMIVVGWMLDRIGFPMMIAPLYLISAVGTLALEHGATLPVLVAGGAMMGVGLGAEFAALSYFIARYFGLRRFGIIAGVMYSAVTIIQGVTPYLMDVDFDHNRSYLLSLHIIEAAVVVGAAIIACLPPYDATARLWRKASTAA